MLVLTRKPEQSLVFGDNIIVTVLAIEGDRVKLGIQAPRDVAVLRQEVQAQVRAANKQAAAQKVNPRTIAEALRRRSTPPSS